MEEIMTDHKTARRDIRRRQKEIAENTVLEFSRAGRYATSKEVNAALVAAGLPPARDDEEFDEIYRGDLDPQLQAMVLSELVTIMQEAPGYSPDCTLGDCLGQLGMTQQEAEALALRRIHEKLGGQQN